MSVGYTFRAADLAFFGNGLGQTFQAENGKLAIYPSGVAGTTSRTLDVTVDALPHVWFDSTLFTPSRARSSPSIAVAGDWIFRWLWLLSRVALSL